MSEPTHRPIVMGTNGMVAAGHPLAAQAGASVLARGGNAVDAAIATSATLAVVMPNMCGLGGDIFALVYRAATGEVRAINASGAAPKRATPDRFSGDRVPERGVLAPSVPGAVHAWGALREAYGTLDLATLLRPAIGYASCGFPVTTRLSEALHESAAVLASHEPSARVYLPGGTLLRPGDVLVQSDLARTLGEIAEKGPEAFYRGSIAERIVASTKGLGGLLREDDLAEHHSHWYAPLATSYRGYDVYGQPPVSQGHILLEELNLAEGFDLAALGHNSADYVHLLVEAKKLAFADRARYLSDPDFVHVPLKGLLSKDYAAAQRRRIELRRAAVDVAAGEPSRYDGNTTYFAVADGQGNCVSLIQSIFGNFGCGIVAGDTGVVLNNRMTGFSLDHSNVNCLRPGKRTAHTLNACMLFKDGRPRLVFGTPGADAQVQSNLQIILNVVDFGMDVQQAIEAPRWFSVGNLDLNLEGRFAQETVADLVSRGHRVHVLEPWSALVGGVQAIMVLPESGVLMGGADPRRDGYAVGL